MLRSLIYALTLSIIPWSYSFSAEPFAVGDQVPAWHLPYATQDSISFEGVGSDDFSAERYLLAFYPADWSAGCTNEMCTFRDAIAEFEELNVRVLPVSGDYVFSHREWARHHNLPFMLLSDPTREFGRRMGVYRDDVGMFKRSVFLVGPGGALEYIDYDYSVADEKDFEALKEALR